MDFISNSKWFSTVPLVALTMLLIGWNLRQTNVAVKRNLYINDTLRFEFAYGNEWVLDSIKLKPGNYHFAGKTDVKFVVKVLPFYHSDYKLLREHYDKATFRNFTKTGGSDIKIGLKEAYKLTFSYMNTENTGTETKILVTEVLVPLKTSIVLFSYTAVEADYPVYEKHFLATLETLKFR